MYQLFDSKTRTDFKLALHNDNRYDYMDRSGREDVSRIRHTLNGWFNSYPVNEQKELKNRFKKSFSSAFYELFLHELFLRQDFEIQVHPIIPGTLKRPDFLIRKNNFEFYVEAKVAKDKSQQEEAIENKINEFYDALNKVQSPNFFLIIKELTIKTQKQPSTRKIIKTLEQKIARCDPDLMAEKGEKMGFGTSEDIVYEDQDIKIIVSLIPKDPEARSLDDVNPIGMLPIESVWGSSADSIKDSFIKKSNRYGILDKPYIICINSTGNFSTNAFDVENALWGSLAWTWSTDPENRKEKLERRRDGIFLGKSGSKSKNVSGVLITKVMEFNIPVSPYWFAKHPFSDNPANFEPFNLGYYYVENGKIKEEKKLSFSEVLNIDPNWLE